MKPIGTESAENKTEESAKETASSLYPSFLAQQYSASEGGVQTDMTDATKYAGIC